jgi:hypothetical protein
MKARVCATGLAALMLVCAGTAPAHAQLAAGLREALYANLNAFNRKDVDATMGTIDSRSPDYAPTKQASETQFEALDVKSEIVAFDYIGHDDEFAVARVKVKTTGKPGSDFTNNTVDSIMIFHQEGGAWKLWSEDILGVQTEQ